MRAIALAGIDPGTHRFASRWRAALRDDTDFRYKR
ncbi:hypothetical protein LMG26788_00949 [Achromobacter pulmonis]|uniref:Uncharacterized protein n=1 Tax=Achromobacter pulmonis TaxID=1389932 RepID=A0A6S7C6N6_9BURK|nr:hypothetical protein LMG26788_00949 [Achromobacter pulmonis]